MIQNILANFKIISLRKNVWSQEADQGKAEDKGEKPMPCSSFPTPRRRRHLILPSCGQGLALIRLKRMLLPSCFGGNLLKTPLMIPALYKHRQRHPDLEKP